jgi:hypothetical protein
VRVHILYHAAEEPLWAVDDRGASAARLCARGGKVRRNDAITQGGRDALAEARMMVRELAGEALEARG